MEIKLRPFGTPNFAIAEATAGLRQEGWKDTPSIPIRNIEAEELSRMCDAWRAEVFRKAEKKDPRVTP